MNTEIVRGRIKFLREKKQFSQQYMADHLFMTLRNYARIERGEHKILDIRLLCQICEILDLLPAEMLLPDDFTIQKKQLAASGPQQADNENASRQYIIDSLTQLNQTQLSQGRQLMEMLRAI